MSPITIGLAPFGRIALLLSAADAMLSMCARNARRFGRPVSESRFASRKFSSLKRCVSAWRSLSVTVDSTSRAKSR
jgi:hypothetical protein